MPRIIEFGLSMPKWDARPFFEADINNMFDVVCLFDSGANIPMVFGSRKMLNDLFPFRNRIRKSGVDGIGGRVNVELFEVPRFVISKGTQGGITFLNTVFAYVERKVDEAHMVLLSGSMFASIDVSISLCKEQLFFRVYDDQIRLRFEPSKENIFVSGMF